MAQWLAQGSGVFSVLSLSLAGSGPLLIDCQVTEEYPHATYQPTLSSECIEVHQEAAFSMVGTQKIKGLQEE